MKKYKIEYVPEYKPYVNKAYWEITENIGTALGMPLLRQIYKADTKEKCEEYLKGVIENERKNSK